MQQNIRIDSITDIVSLTDLRYKTHMILDKLLQEAKPLLLVKRSKKIAIIYPLIEQSGERRPQYALEIKSYPLGATKNVSRKILYDDYLNKKLR